MANPWLESKRQRCSFHESKIAQQVRAHKLKQIPADTSNNVQTPHQQVQTTDRNVLAGAAQSTLEFNLQQLSCLQPQQKLMLSYLQPRQKLELSCLQPRRELLAAAQLLATTAEAAAQLLATTAGGACSSSAACNHGSQWPKATTSLRLVSSLKMVDACA